jgi:TB2/DP1, HVA22 family
VADFCPAYLSIKAYREASNEALLQFWQKYWSVRSLLLILDYVIWPYLEDFTASYFVKIGIYLSLSSLGLAENIYDSVVTVAYVEIEPYADILLEHTAFTQYFVSWKGHLTKFFIQELEEFLVVS